MRNKLLLTTALVASAFASNAFAADKNIAAIGDLQTYAASEDAHQLWIDNVDVNGIVSGELNSGFIQANKLSVNNSNFTVSGAGVFISGAEGGTNIASDSTVTLTKDGQLLSAYSDSSNLNLSIDGTIDMQGGIIRAASNKDGDLFSKLNINDGGKVLVSTAGTNVIGSRSSNVSGAIEIAQDATLELVGDLTRDPSTGIMSLDTDAKAKKGVMNITKTGAISNNGTLNANQVVIKNNGLIDNRGTVNLSSYESDGGYLGSETAENTINFSGGDINLANNARIVAATADDKGSINIANAGNINLNNGSTIDAINLTITGDAVAKTQINIGGNNAGAGRETSEKDSWRNNSYILGYADSSIKNSEVNVNNGGHIMQGATGSGETATGHTMTLKDSTINVNNGGMLIAHAKSDFVLDGTEVNLNGGNINAVIKSGADSKINVNSSASGIKKITALDELNIATDTAVSKLLAEASTVTDANVLAGNSFSLDKDLLTATDLNINGTVNVSTDYASITNTNVNKGGLLNVGTSNYASAVTLKDGSTLNVGVAQKDDAIINGKVGTLTGTTLEGEKANMNLVFASDLDTSLLKDPLNFADSVTDKVNLNENMLYNYNSTDMANGNVSVSKKNQSEVLSGLANAGVSSNQSGTLAAFTSGNGSNAQANAINAQMSQLLQTGNTQAAAEIAKAVAPDAGPAVQSVSTENANQIFGAVGTRLSGGSVSTGAEGKSAGDNVFERAAVWAQGILNKSKLDKADGFDADSQGMAIGAEKYINDDVKLGIGYAYTNTDIDANLRSTEVDTHTAIVYGEYKPSDWYVNGIASYGWSDYSETKNVAGAFVTGDYDVNTFGLQAMTGYDFDVNGTKLTPEAGLRYVNIDQKSYTDSAGQKIKTDSSDILTGVIGAKLSKDFALESGMTLRPEARLAMTYDLTNDDSSSAVTLANGSAYRVTGEALDRFGIEVGTGVTTDVNDNLELSVGYEGRFRQDYQDHTGLLNAKYKF